MCNSYTLFMAEMKEVFDPVQGKEAASRLLSLRQGPNSVADYAIEFRILAAECRWDDITLQGVFLCRLADTIKDEPASLYL